jgi:ABC-type Fe3+ transport system permease subunit
MENKTEEAKKNGWGNKLSSFWKRIISFVQNPVAVIYFLSIVVITASVGVWYPLLLEKPIEQNADQKTEFINSILLSLGTYAISILAGTMADFLLGARSKKRSNALKIFTFSVFIIAFLASFIAIATKIWFFGVSGVALTLLLWIVVFADDEAKSEKEIDPNSSSGGSNVAGAQISGNTTGFAV